MKRASCKFTCVGGGGLQEGGGMPVKKKWRNWAKYFPSSFTFPSPFRALNHKILIALSCQRFECEWPRAKKLPTYSSFAPKKILDNFSRILAEVNCCKKNLTAFLPLLTFRIFHPTLFSSRKKRGTAAITSFFLREIRYFTWLHPLEKHKPSKPQLILPSYTQKVMAAFRTKRFFKNAFLNNQQYSGVNI